VIGLTTSTTDSVIGYYFQTCRSKKSLMAWFFCHFYTTCHLFNIRVVWFTSCFHFCTCFAFISEKNCSRGCSCVCNLVVGTSLLPSKISFSLSSETTEHVSPYNSHKVLPSFTTVLCKVMIATEGSYKRKWRGYLNELFLCCSLMILKIRGQDQSVCNLRSKHPASSCQ